MMNLPKWAFDPILMLCSCGAALNTLAWWAEKPLESPLKEFAEGSVLVLIGLIINRKDRERRDEKEKDEQH